MIDLHFVFVKRCQFLGGSGGVQQNGNVLILPLHEERSKLLVVLVDHFGVMDAPNLGRHRPKSCGRLVHLAQSIVQVCRRSGGGEDDG